jgi:uncharacterized protein YndB with AHSA1/START domain
MTSRTLTIAPVRKSVVVNADAATAFEIFTADIDRWWPKSHDIGASPIVQSIFEPFVGGRWYTKCEDGSEVSVGRVRVWEPGQRVVFSWDINSNWKPDLTVSSEVEVSFIAEAAEVTRVNVEHRHFEALGEAGGNKMRNDVDNGWPGLLDLYAKAVDTSLPRSAGGGAE